MAHVETRVQANSGEPRPGKWTGLAHANKGHPKEGNRDEKLPKVAKPVVSTEVFRSQTNIAMYK